MKNSSKICTINSNISLAAISIPLWALPFIKSTSKNDRSISKSVKDFVPRIVITNYFYFSNFDTINFGQIL
jgi:hypothetical protein